jgi:2-polyprenyl-6-methoxyphenol hydroxylase-like FAD-dependent oxidoreductase
MVHYIQVLDTIGLAQMLMDSGIHSKGMAFYAGARKLLEVNMAQLHDETKFPVMLAIPQHEVESIFREKLASKDVEIFRNRTAVGMKEAPMGDGLEVSFEDGAVVRAQYVVGADGSRSTVGTPLPLHFFAWGAEDLRYS